MANSIHLSFLKQGIEVWNNWREHNPNIIPDLSKADLSGLNLNQGDFRYAKLHSVNLRKAQLYNTNFCNADLRACL
ncbi:MAG: pentapeptide repeat-containing protein, partial [Xenococcus sp. (in: cyanobacteria)]